MNYFILLFALFFIFILYKVFKPDDERANTYPVKFGIVLFGVIIGVGFIAFLLNSGSAKNRFENNWRNKDNSGLAYLYLQEHVKAKLKTPSVAKFPDERNVQILKEGRKYSIKGYVDSQNSFGAMLRLEYVGVIEQIDENNFKLIELYMLE